MNKTLLEFNNVMIFLYLGISDLNLSAFYRLVSRKLSNIQDKKPVQPLR